MDQLSRRTHASEPSITQERPLSWHPTSYEQPIDFSQYQHVDFFPQFEFSASSFNTAEINGLITPMSAPVPNEPQIQEYMTPLEDYSPLSYANLPFAYQYMSKVGSYYLPEQNYDAEEQPYAPEQVSYSSQFNMPHMYQPRSTDSSQLNIATAPPSPTLLPIQNFNHDGSTSPFVLGSPRVEKEELVGMGLYDRPQDVQSSTLFNGGLTSMAALTAGIGKGLKLEESFEPPPTEDDELDTEEDTEEQDEPEDLGASTAAVSNIMLTPQLYVEDQSNYAGQTFFFDDKEGQHLMPAATHLSYPHHQNYEWIARNDQPYDWI